MGNTIPAIKINGELRSKARRLEELSEEVAKKAADLRKLNETQAALMGHSKDLSVYLEKTEGGAEALENLSEAMAAYAKVLDDTRKSYYSAQEDAILRAMKIKKP